GSWFAQRGRRDFHGAPDHQRSHGHHRRSEKSRRRRFRLFQHWLKETLMFDSTSRYYTIETSKITVPDGEGGTREIRYARRRFIPPSEGLTTLVEHTVAQGERLDQITAR